MDHKEFKKFYAMGKQNFSVTIEDWAGNLNDTVFKNMSMHEIDCDLAYYYGWGNARLTKCEIVK